jgi:PAS domain S-box-containing protein
MKTTKPLAPWALVAGLSIAALAAGAIGFSSMRDQKAAAEWSSWVIHTQRILELLDHTRTSIFEVLYQVSSEPSHNTGGPDPADSIGTLRSQIAELRYLTADNREEQVRLSRIDQLLASPRAVSAAGTTRPKHDTLQDWAGRQNVLHEIRREIEGMSVIERQLLAERRTKMMSALEQSRLTLEAGGGIVFLWLAVLSAIAIVRGKRLEQTTEILVQKHEELGRMAERERGEQKFRRLLEAAPDALFILDRNRRILMANAQAERLFGYSKADLLGRGVWTLVPKRFYALEFDRIGPSVELSGLRANGEEFPLEATLSPVENETDAVYCAAVRDITERKLSEEAVRQAVQMTETDRLRKEFLARISHELRTPLNAIIGTAELRLSGELAGDQRRDFEMIQSSGELLLKDQRRDFEMIQSSGELLLKIVNDLLELSKITVNTPALEKIDFNLLHLTEGIVDSLAAIARKKDLELTLYLDPAIPPGLRGDPVKLRQIINNLLSNAIKFTVVGDVLLSIKLKQATATEVDLKFEVADTGIGIAPDVLGRLFQPFVQADESIHRRFGGTGLGLSIASQLVQQMGGTITVESELGKGSTFHFTIRFERGAEIVQDWNTTAIVPPSLTVRALIVDDSAVQRKVLSEYLTAWGIANHAIASGAATVEELLHARDQDRPYMLLLLDEGLPGASGFSLIRAIKEHSLLRDIKVILMISAEHSGGVQGIDGSVVKPVRPSRLFNALQEILSNHLPNYTDFPPLTATTAQSPPVPSKAKARVLVVEDNLTNQKVVARQLTALGYQAKIVGGARHALKEVAQEHYDIMLLDCELPDMDGYDAVRELRKQEGAGAHLPVVALTAHASEGQREKCLSAGMDDFLSKPVRLSALGQCIEKWSNGKFNKPATLQSSDAFSTKETGDEGFDRAQLAAVAKLVRANGSNALGELINEFLRDVRIRIVEIKQAIESEDLRQLGLLAHSLVSASAVLGAMRFSRLCSAIEHCARAGSLNEAAFALRDLETEAKKLPRWFDDNASVSEASALG